MDFWSSFSYKNFSCKKNEYYALDTYRQTNEKIFNAVEFNSEETEPCLSEHSTNYDFRCLVKDKNNFKNPENRIV